MLYINPKNNDQSNPQKISARCIALNHEQDNNNNYVLDYEASNSLKTFK